MWWRNTSKGANLDFCRNSLGNLRKSLPCLASCIHVSVAGWDWGILKFSWAGLVNNVKQNHSLCIVGGVEKLALPS